MLLLSPRFFHSSFIHSTGTSGLPFCTAPQQHPRQSDTCARTTRFVCTVNMGWSIENSLVLLTKAGFSVVVWVLLAGAGNSENALSTAPAAFDNSVMNPRWCRFKLIQAAIGRHSCG